MPLYKSLPGKIALIEPDGREVKGLTWFSWTRTGGIANGILMNANGCCGAAAVVSVTRPRDGHFTRMSITTQQTQKFTWPPGAQEDHQAGVAGVSLTHAEPRGQGCVSALAFWLPRGFPAAQANSAATRAPRADDL